MARHAWETRLLELPTEVVGSCPACGSTSSRRDSRWEHLLHIGASPYGVRRCEECSVRWLSPRPTAEGYREIYSSELYFGGEGASPLPYDDLARRNRAYFHRRIEEIASLHGGRAKRLRMLDFGAATGEFVVEALEAGHEALGIELSDDARNIAASRGLRLLRPEELGQLGSGEFDVVHMNHVLEHMPDPLDHLRVMRGLLRPAGLLVVEVPQQFDNDLDRLKRWLRLGGKQARLDAFSLHHTCFYSPSSLRRLLERAGFRVLRLRTFNPERAPLWPPVPRHWAARILLSAADRMHGGGNLIEAFARPA